MVRGLGIAVIAVACTYQWAETTRIARGRGTDWPNARQASVYRFFSSAFIGFPCPKNAAGMTVMSPPPVVLAIIAPAVAACEGTPFTRPPAPGAARAAATARRSPRGRR